MRLLAFLSLALATHADCCSNSFLVAAPTLTCQFNFVPYSSVCASSKFNYCTISYCALPFAPDATCSKYNSFNEFSFTNCMKYCCASSTNSGSTYNAVAACANSDKGASGSSSGSDVGRIVMVVMGILAGLSLFLTLAFCLYRKSNTSQVRANEPDNPEAPKYVKAKALPFE
jgi:hypothetical protein